MGRFGTPRVLEWSGVEWCCFFDTQYALYFFSYTLIGQMIPSFAHMHTVVIIRYLRCLFFFCTVHCSLIAIAPTDMLQYEPMIGKGVLTCTVRSESFVVVRQNPTQRAASG